MPLDPKVAEHMRMAELKSIDKSCSGCDGCATSVYSKYKFFPTEEFYVDI